MFKPRSHIHKFAFLATALAEKKTGSPQILNVSQFVFTMRIFFHNISREYYNKKKEILINSLLK